MSLTDTDALSLLEDTLAKARAAGADAADADAGIDFFMPALIKLCNCGLTSGRRAEQAQQWFA